MWCSMTNPSQKPSTKVRVRFAPSPTGYLHVGNARTALFNWLFARRHHGTFILRIEDTDVERSTEDSGDSILSDLRWLKLDWDEGPDVGGPFGPYKQSLRLKLYEKYLEKLKAKNLAYPCYCAPEELQRRREKQLSEGRPPRYDNRCRDLSAEQIASLELAGTKASWRFRVREEKLCVHDLVRGDVSFDTATLGDFVIVKSDGNPTFHFAVCIDDALMGITHVIRGEDHLSNTPRHLLLFRELGFAVPGFAHLSMILGPDGSRLSKRHGASSVMELRALGYLPEAAVNYMALLGWSPRSKKEIVDVDAMAAEFDVKDVSKSAAIFDMEKFGWVNSQYLKKAPEGKIADAALPYLRDAGLVGGDLGEEEFAYLRKVIRVVVPYVKNLTELPAHARMFLAQEDPEWTGDVAEVLRGARVPELLGRLSVDLNQFQDWEPKAVQAFLTQEAKTMGLGGKEFYMPVRAALTGHIHGPELMDVIPILGKERCLARIQQTLTRLKNFTST